MLANLNAFFGGETDGPNNEHPFHSGNVRQLRERLQLDHHKVGQQSQEANVGQLFTKKKLLIVLLIQLFGSMMEDQCNELCTNKRILISHHFGLLIIK
jgi:hypothetical protein